MTQNLPAYLEQPVPENIRPYVRRILQLEFHERAQITIPARPTGHIYIGLFAEGSSVATACDKRFECKAGDCHISGQLTTFDAEYSLTGPAHHVLAEFTPTGAYRLLKRSPENLKNRIDIFAAPKSQETAIDRLCALLADWAKQPGEDDQQIARAAQLIEERRGVVSISDLAQEVGMSERSFLRGFSSVVGIAPKPYAMIKRTLFVLEKLARNPEVDIADIAAEGGFSDQSHLTNIFKIYMRATPRKLELDRDGVLTSIVSGA